MKMRVFHLDDFIKLPYMGICKKYKHATPYHELDECSATDDEIGMSKYHGCVGCAYKTGEG